MKKLGKLSISLEGTSIIKEEIKIVVGRVINVEESNYKVLIFIVENHKDNGQKIRCIARGNDAHRYRHLIRKNEMIRIKKDIPSRLMNQRSFEMISWPERRNERGEVTLDEMNETLPILSIDYRTDIRLLPDVKSQSVINNEINEESTMGNVRTSFIFGTPPPSSWGSLAQHKPRG